MAMHSIIALSIGVTPCFITTASTKNKNMAATDMRLQVSAVMSAPIIAPAVALSAYLLCLCSHAQPTSATPKGIMSKVKPMRLKRSANEK